MKKPSSVFRSVSIFMAASILLSSCVSSTMISSNPSGARIYVDGQPMGTTPFLYSDTKIVGSTTTVKLEKEGFEPFNTIFSRTEQADVGAIVAGVFVWVPFLWVMKYNPMHSYELKPNNGGNSPQPQLNKQTPQNQTKSKADRLRDLKALLDEKIITQAEYDQEKKKILAEEEK